MARKNEIVHEGRIIEITPDFTSVEILVASACASCHAKGLCGMSEEEQKVIMLPTDPYALHNVGDKVQVCTKMSMGFKAAWVAYVVPLAILLVMILALTAAGVGELVAALASVGGVALYYFVIWLLRGRLQNEFVFYIKQLNSI